MSYQDDEEFKEGDIEEEVDILADAEVDEPLDDDLIAISEDDDEEDDTLEGFAGIDGAEY